MDEINLNASLWRVTTDHEGDSTVSFKIPQSDLKEVLKVAEQTNVLLKLTITSK